jgi:hypothetical protein
MEAPMPGGKTRIEVAKDAIQTTYATMIQRSLRQGQIHPRYRIAMVGYKDELYDVYKTEQNNKSILNVEELKEQGVPPITPQKWTNMAKAFRYAAHLIKEDLKTWPQKWLDECPPPMVINLTDCEYTEAEGVDDPLSAAKKVQEITVPDGNVLCREHFHY